MKFSSVLAFAVGVSAAPWQGWKGCVSDEQAAYFASQSTIFLMHTDLAAAKAAAYSIFDAGIVEYGDSINALRQAPLGTMVENGITTYVADTLSAPPITAINTLDIVHNCDKVVWHWEFIGIGPQRIRGFTLMYINSAGKIYEQQVEFNSYTWATDLGATVTYPPGSPFA